MEAALNNHMLPRCHKIKFQGMTSVVNNTDIQLGSFKGTKGHGWQFNGENFDAGKNIFEATKQSHVCCFIQTTGNLTGVCISK